MSDKKVMRVVGSEPPEGPLAYPVEFAHQMSELYGSPHAIGQDVREQLRGSLEDAPETEEE